MTLDKECKVVTMWDPQEKVNVEMHGRIVDPEMLKAYLKPPKAEKKRLIK